MAIKHILTFGLLFATLASTQVFAAEPAAQKSEAVTPHIETQLEIKDGETRNNEQLFERFDPSDFAIDIAGPIQFSVMEEHRRVFAPERGVERGSSLRMQNFGQDNRLGQYDSATLASANIRLKF